jgi:hypothetical protein
VTEEEEEEEEDEEEEDRLCVSTPQAVCRYKYLRQTQSIPTTVYCTVRLAKPKLILATVQSQESSLARRRARFSADINFQPPHTTTSTTATAAAILHSTCP